LADVVKQRGCLTEPEAACYLREIVTAVSHLHAMVRGLTAGWIKLTYLEQCKMIGVNA
jgi:serine/threonine protein kinase